MVLNNFYRNIKTSSSFSSNSFIGKFIFRGIWDDNEYWKLEKDLLKIYKNYRHKNVPRKIFADILSISEVFLISNTSEILFKKNGILQPYYSLGFNPKERYDVLIYCIFGLYEKEFNVYDFEYQE